MTSVLVVGGGMAGCCAAHLLSDKGWDVTLVETASFLGGGCKTFFYGGHPYTYGPRHFLTQDESLFAFLNQYVPMRRIGHEHECMTYVERDAAFYHWPIHQDDITRMPDAEKILEELQRLNGGVAGSNFEERWLGSVGQTLYDKFARTYSKKMWHVASNTELDGFEFASSGVKTAPSVRIRTGAKAYFADDDVISAFPTKRNGYDDYFQIATRRTTVHLNTTIEAFDVERHRVKIQGAWQTYDLIVSTISPEILLHNAFGPLRWMGRDFFKFVLPVKEVFPPNVYFLYYANDEPFTRVVEYKKFYQYEAPTTLLGIEIPSFRNKLYPFPCQKDQEIARQYLAALPNNVFSIGRAGSYRYIDIDDIIRQCFDLMAKI